MAFMTAFKVRTNPEAEALALHRPHAAGADGRGHRRAGLLLWSAQGLLALLFIFAGGSKLVMSGETLTGDTGLPVLFMRFIGVAEMLGALGLILPGIARIRTGLTPLAAAGLVIIMIGATTATLAVDGPAPALFPLVVGLLCAFVAFGRLRLAPRRASGSAAR